VTLCQLPSAASDSRTQLASLSRDAMRKRGLLLSPGVRPSVCLSVTLVYCIHTAEDIVKPLSRPGSPIILFFTPSAGTQLELRRGTPSAGAQNTRLWESFAIFDWNRRLSRQLYEIGPWLLWNVNRTPQAADRSVSIPMTLSDLWPGFQGQDILWSRIQQTARLKGQSYYNTLIGNHT